MDRPTWREREEPRPTHRVGDGHPGQRAKAKRRDRRRRKGSGRSNNHTPASTDREVGTA